MGSAKMSKCACRLSLGVVVSSILNAGLHGVLGSDVLSADGSVIVDYDGAHLWLVKG